MPRADCSASKKVVFDNPHQIVFNLLVISFFFRGGETNHSSIEPFNAKCQSFWVMRTSMGHGQSSYIGHCPEVVEKKIQRHGDEQWWKKNIY